MENNKLTPGKFSTNYGLILGGLMITIAIILYATGMALEGVQWPVYLYYIAFPVIIIYAIIKYKKYNANMLTLGEALKIGLVIAAISGLVYAFYAIVFNYIIDPDYVNKIVEVSEVKIAELDAPVEAKEAQLKAVKLFSNPLVGSAFWLAMSLLFGLIYSLVAGLVMKKTE